MSWAAVSQERRNIAEQILTTPQLRVLQHRIDGHSWRTIGTALGISEATARGHYHAALKRIQRHDHERRHQ